MLTTEPRPKPCKVCQAPFTPARPLQRVCGPVCARKAVNQQKAIERAEIRGRKESIKSLRELLAECQIAFNAYIRARDADQPCIDCGKPFEPNKPGGSMDAGHYLGRGSSPQHRFNEDNVFGQRKNCNRPGGATRDAFRAGVVARIGVERVEALETEDGVPKWDRAFLIELKAHYRAKLRELKAGQA
jgi:hypothetical protein